MKKYIKIISAVVICFIIAFSMLFLAKKVYYKVKNIRQERRIIEKNKYSLLQNIQKLTETKPESITLQELTDFEWDYVYDFVEYTDPDYIEEVIGMKSVYPLYFKGDGDETSVLFMNKGKIVCYLGGPEERLKCRIWLNWGAKMKYRGARFKYQDIHTIAVEYGEYPRLMLADKDLLNDYVKSYGEGAIVYTKDGGKHWLRKWEKYIPN